MQRVHFIGIGGAGVSGLARMMLAAGHQVSGSDRALTPTTTELAKLGATIFEGQGAQNISSDLDLVIYTIAVPESDPELRAAREQGIKIFSYPEYLGELSKNKFTIAVAGTHGKTTTTAMLAEIMVAAGLDPTVIVGSPLNSSGSNFRAGQSDFLLVEACEYRRSFLNLHPQILIITNIEADHLDYYRDLADIKNAFSELAAQVPATGKVITEREYARVKLPISLKVPGEHNQRNAQVAMAAAQVLGISEEQARRALASFAGTARRLEFKGRVPGGAQVYDDYAHHPTAIKTTIAAARQLADGKILAVFQPHLYSRTKQLFAEFAASFAEADEVWILPIYAAREPRDERVSAPGLAEAVGRVGPPANFAPNFEAAAAALTSTAGPHDLILLMGAGDIYKLADLLLSPYNGGNGKSGGQKLE